MNNYLSCLGICVLLLMLSCTSQMSVKAEVPVDTGNGILLDEALSDIAAYYVGSLPTNTKIVPSYFKHCLLTIFSVRG
jgi:hypothetical protein